MLSSLSLSLRIEKEKKRTDTSLPIGFLTSLRAVWGKIAFMIGAWKAYRVVWSEKGVLLKILLITIVLVVVLF